MANLPASASRRFNPADFRTAPEWFTGRFLSQLNLFTDPVYQALLNGLNFSQNFNAQYYTQTLTGGASAAANAFSFKQTITGNPTGVIKLACNVSGNLSTPLTSAVDFSWYATSGVVYITSVIGLTSGITYNLSLLVF